MICIDHGFLYSIKVAKGVGLILRRSNLKTGEVEFVIRPIDTKHYKDATITEFDVTDGKKFVVFISFSKDIKKPNWGQIDSERFEVTDWEPESLWKISPDTAEEWPVCCECGSPNDPDYLSDDGYCEHCEQLMQAEQKHIKESNFMRELRSL